VIKMSSLSEQLLFTTVRIEAEDSHGNLQWGTGFLFSFALEGDLRLPVMVTNRHMVRGYGKGRFGIHESVDTDTGQAPSDSSHMIQIDDFESKWIGHPNPDVDLCGMPFQPLVANAQREGKTLYTRYFDATNVLSDEKAADLTAAEDILMIGYPNALWDEQNNLPLLRRGITSSHPGLDFCGRPEFVIDCACFPGSSGSPVVLFNSGSYVSKNGNITLGGGRFALLGALRAGPYMTAEGNIVIGAPAPTGTAVVSRTNLMINLGYVIKAREILALGEHMKDLLKDHLVKDEHGAAPANG
jgi:hypothetical protein